MDSHGAFPGCLLMFFKMLTFSSLSADRLETVYRQSADLSTNLY